MSSICGQHCPLATAKAQALDAMGGLDNPCDAIGQVLPTKEEKLETAISTSFDEVMEGNKDVDGMSCEFSCRAIRAILYDRILSPPAVDTLNIMPQFGMDI